MRSFVPDVHGATGLEGKGWGGTLHVVKKSSESFSGTDAISPRRAAAAIGVSESSVKRWCDQGLLAAVRTPGGHRRLPIPAVLRFARANGRPLRAAQREARAAALVGNASRSPPPKPLRIARADLSRALLADDRAAVRATLETQWSGGCSVDVLCDALVAPVFVAIGERWSRGAIEIYEERRACELLRQCLYDLSTCLAPTRPKAPRAIGGTLEGDPYDLPTIMAELVLLERGFDARSLGSGLPGATIARAIAELKPRLVWLGVGHADDRRRLVAECAIVERAATAAGAALVVGGAALVAPLRKELRYAAFCDGMVHLASFADALGAVPR